ncbi:MAG: sigma-70 family RNA polymerase sigma factor [Hyphomonadaceae bacterium]
MYGATAHIEEMEALALGVRLRGLKPALEPAHAQGRGVQLRGALRSAGWTSADAAPNARPRSSEAADKRVNEVEELLHGLMVRGLAGDAAAHRLLLETLGERFRVFFRSRMRIGDPSHIEDLVQETLIAIHTRRESYNPAQPLRAWVYAIARYKLIDHFRRTKTSGVSVPVDEIEDLFSNEEADASDPARDVAALLDRLPAKQRIAIRLVKLEELSVREAAQRTGMSESDIKISIHRGMKKLSALVAKDAQA